MTSKDSSDYTYNCLSAGVAVNIALLIIANGPYTSILASLFGIVKWYPAGIVDNKLSSLPVSSIIGSTILGGIGVSILWVSSRLDFIDEEPDKLKKVVKNLKWIFLASWVLLVAHLWMESMQGPAKSFLTILILIPLSIIAIPGVVPQIGYVFMCTSLFWAGMLCLPRAITFLKTSHKMRDVWNEGKNDGRFNPFKMRGSFGEPSSSAAHARAMRKDLKEILRDAQAKRDQVAALVAGMRKGIHDDVQRMQDEAKLSALLAEIEELGAQADVLKTYKTGG